ncbi:hypothetical protein BD779DRAFT_1568628 [Infundibulicybe gibba]|nr:hypothetical protein BD779DRAFT_1568628 [Infundibulicybe gibba]
MGDVEVPLFLSELKRNVGGGHSDPVIQAGCSMKQWFQPDRSRMRDRCCCPTFILAGSGPWLCILGAAITHRVIIQRLTDMMWIGLSSTNEDGRIRRFARVMAALSQNLFASENTTSRLEADAGCVTYLAKIRRDAESPDVDQRVVIKFVDQYGDEVHRFLAGRDSSSGYLFDNSMKMVVMNYVEPHPRPAGARTQLEAILTDLHTAGYVFGDLREPNVLFDGNGRAKLIDFDWAGRITWAEGVGPLAPIRPEHDWRMLGKL